MRVGQPADRHIRRSGGPAPVRRRRALTAVAAASGVFTTGYLAGFGARSQLFGEFPYRAGEAESAADGPKRIALTFDDGPNEPFTSQLLDELDRHQAKATFFQVGRCAERFPSVTRRVVQDGHLLGNHSYHHEFTRYLREPAQREEVGRAQRVLTDIAGVSPALYRPPWLCHWPWVLRTIRGHGLQPISGRFGHPLEVFQPPAARMARGAERLATPGAILIFHDGYDARGGRRDQTVLAAGRLLSSLGAQGYQFVTVAELLGVPGYLELGARPTGAGPSGQ